MSRLACRLSMSHSPPGAGPRWRGATLLLLPLLAVSCVRFHGPEDVRDVLSRRSGLRVKQDVGITVTRSGMWLARSALDWSGEEEISLRGLRRIEVGVYEVRASRRGREVPAPLELHDLGLDRWRPLVRVQDEEQNVFVLVREKRDSIRGMLVVVIDPEEWVLVRMRGRLEPVLEEVMRLAFEQADRPGLYEEVRRERERQEGGPGVAGQPATGLSRHRAD